ncbi:MAG TPA: 2-dehydro-3-deoxy-6-phosphogalactonate aldolase [Steroidobacteraceae bacterium]|jgi:2-dehydro-3-deoxyphosphogalactonate aldolase|nr:2-dehydro-3-deoxy-6-phosphogalactonate aldolase [Steroidobacteraceae bacterium]
MNDVELVAILRGLTPARAPEVGAALVGCGFRTIEVPLNSPQPFDTIELLSRAYGASCLIGAGTVLTAAEVDRVHGAGGRLVVAPNCEGEVIRRALDLGMRVLPGIATATEAFAAVRHGATGLKLFPASTYGVAHLKALKSVLPQHVKVYPVGGIGSQDIAGWLASGADGFGFGGELFKPAYTLAELTKRAQDLMKALRDAMEKDR